MAIVKITASQPSLIEYLQRELKAVDDDNVSVNKEQLSNGCYSKTQLPVEDSTPVAVVESSPEETNDKEDYDSGITFHLRKEDLEAETSPPTLSPTLPPLDSSGFNENLARQLDNFSTFTAGNESNSGGYILCNSTVKESESVLGQSPSSPAGSSSSSSSSGRLSFASHVSEEEGGAVIGSSGSSVGSNHNKNQDEQCCFSPNLDFMLPYVDKENSSEECLSPGMQELDLIPTPSNFQIDFCHEEQSSERSISNYVSFQ